MWSEAAGACTPHTLLTERSATRSQPEAAGTWPSPLPLCTLNQFLSSMYDAFEYFFPWILSLPLLHAVEQSAFLVIILIFKHSTKNIGEEEHSLIHRPPLKITASEQPMTACLSPGYNKQSWPSHPIALHP